MKTANDDVISLNQHRFVYEASDSLAPKWYEVIISDDKNNARKKIANKGYENYKDSQ